MSTNTLSAKDLAAECGVDAKTVRKFLREHFAATERIDELPGQGGRYAFSKADVKSLAKLFKAQAGNKAERKAEKAKATVEAENIDDIDEVEDLDFEELDGPADEELEELEITADLDSDEA